MDITPRHQWTHDGTRVLVVRSGDTGHGGFAWPTTVGARLQVAQPTRTAACDAGGYYGWPWAFGIGDGKDPDWSARWLVYAADPADVIAIGDKVKCCGEIEIVHVGDWASATAYVLPGQMAWVAHAAQGAASATGESGAASATGWSGAASATGWSGAASATGESGAASATGWRGAASATGESGAAFVTGLDGRAQAGPYGVIALAWWHEAAGRQEMRCARIGVGDGSDGLLKARVWYRLDARGEFVEA